MPALLLQRTALVRLMEEELHEARAGPGRPLERQAHLLLDHTLRAQLALPLGTPAQQAPVVVERRHAERVGLSAGRALQPVEQALGEVGVRHAHLGRREAGTTHGAAPRRAAVTQRERECAVAVAGHAEEELLRRARGRDDSQCGGTLHHAPEETGNASRGRHHREHHRRQRPHDAGTRKLLGRTQMTSAEWHRIHVGN